jgi:SAM-dependent methyltransferase
MAYRLEHAGAGVDWEARYVAGETPWDKGAPHPALVDWLKENAMPGRVLVPGCGAGHDVRAISRGDASQVVGVDLSLTAIRHAHTLGGKGNEQYVVGDFLAGEPFEKPFDWIFEHTCFCAIPPMRRVDYVQAAANALGFGGHLVAVFFTHPDNDDPHSPPFACSVEELDAFFGGQFELLSSKSQIKTYPGREGREVFRIFKKRAT